MCMKLSHSKVPYLRMSRLLSTSLIPKDVLDAKEEDG
jgi:hypothetical protein